MHALSAALLLLASLGPAAAGADSNFLTSVGRGATTLAPPARPQPWAAEQTAGASLPHELRDEARPREAAPPEPTGAAAADDGLEAAEMEARFKIITYTSCVTIGTYIHCGLHTPVIDASNSASGRRATPDTVRAALLVAGALGLLLSWVQ